MAPLTSFGDENSSLSVSLFRAQHGDEHARAELPTQLLPVVGEVSRQICRSAGFGHDPSVIEEVQAETMLSIFRPDLTPYEPGRGDVRSYVRGRALNAIKVCRPLRSDLLHPGVEEGESNGANDDSVSRTLGRNWTDSPILELAAPNADPAELVAEDEERSIRAEKVHGFLVSTAGLESSLRRHFFDDVPVSRLAEEEGIHHTTLLRRIRRALDQGKQILAPLMAAS